MNLILFSGSEIIPTVVSGGESLLIEAPAIDGRIAIS